MNTPNRFTAFVAQRLIPAVAVGIGVLATAQHGMPSSPRTSDVQSGSATGTTEAVTASTPVPTPAGNSHVVVNGQPIPVDANGNTSVTLSGGATHVDVSGGNTTVTTTNPVASENSAAGNANNVNVSVDSSSSGSGSSSSFTSNNSFSSSSTFSSSW